MIPPEVQHLLSLAEESHQVAKVLRFSGHVRFAAAQSYYTIFYLAQALLLSKGLTYSSHSAVVAAFGKEFAKTKILDAKFHRYIIDAQVVREVGHYGRMWEVVTEEQEKESFAWAEEFLLVTKNYFGS